MVIAFKFLQFQIQIYCMNDFQIDTKTESTEPLLTISIAAIKLGVSPETLRLYERKGLVNTYKTSTGRRLYSQKDLEWIACIRQLIVINKLNISGIKCLLALIPCWDFIGCSQEEQASCPAYSSNDHVCWKLEDTPCRKKAKDCYSCSVYRAAPKVDHLKKYLTLKMKQ